MEADPQEQLRARLTAEYPDWHICVTRPDEDGFATLVAKRIAHITEALVEDGLFRYLPQAGDYASLERQLQRQTERARELGIYPEKVLL